jgi:hypothetical protein
MWWIVVSWSKKVVVAVQSVLTLKFQMVVLLPVTVMITVKTTLGVTMNVNLSLLGCRDDHLVDKNTPKNINNNVSDTII